MSNTSAQSARVRQEKSDRVILEFDDNNLLGALFGRHDENLARVEQALGISIASRGNRLVLEGASSSCRLAADILRHLYAHLQAGHPVDQGEVEGALRMSEAGDLTASPAFPGSGNKSRKHKRPSAAANNSNGFGKMELKTRKKIISARSPLQAEYIACLQRDLMVFGVGPAGTGKTYLAVATAVAFLMVGEVDRIIVSRPAVEAGENLGFLPGDMKEKVDPYLRPIYDALYDMLPADQVERYLDSGQIEIAPLAFMRGRTLSDAFVILDEAQNTTVMQMKMFLTRFGQNSRMVVAGDPTQTDLPSGAKSGLNHALRILEDIDGISIVRFTEADVVRHPLVGRIVGAYAGSDEPNLES